MFIPSAHSRLRIQRFRAGRPFASSSVLVRLFTKSRINRKIFRNTPSYAGRPRHQLAGKEHQAGSGESTGGAETGEVTGYYYLTLGLACGAVAWEIHPLVRASHSLRVFVMS